MITDSERLNFLEQTARLSRTGVFFEWVAAFEGTGYRLMRHNHLGEPKRTIREAIDVAINERKLTK